MIPFSIPSLSFIVSVSRVPSVFFRFLSTQFGNGFGCILDGFGLYLVVDYIWAFCFDFSLRRNVFRILVENITSSLINIYIYLSCSHFFAFSLFLVWTAIENNLSAYCSPEECMCWCFWRIVSSCSRLHNQSSIVLFLI